MARIKLALPEKFQFETEINIRITDINYGGHLGNDSVLAFIHEARVRLLNHHGFSELDAGAGTGMIQSDALIVFKNEAFYGESVIAKVAVTEISRNSCDFVFQLLDKESGREITRAKTGIVFFNYSDRKISKTPDEFRKIFGS